VEQLLAHLVGDYLMQPDWMSRRKSNSWLWALIHGLIYSLPFLFLKPSLLAWAIIFLSHALIDRYRLAHYVARLKNGVWSGDGYPAETPDYLRVWLMIITDNTLHLLINYACLRFL
jgi:hypothetical protein